MRNKLKHFFILLFLCSLQSCIESKYENEEQSVNITSIKSDKSIQGSFVLGTGSVRSVDYYYFFRKDEDFNGFVKSRVPVDESIIVEKDTVPHIVVKRILKTTTWLDDRKIWRGYVDTKVSKIPDKIDSKYKYIIFVPKGVITDNVNWEVL